MYYPPVDIDLISEKMKAWNCWAVWKEETVDGRQRKIPYCTRTQQANVNKPETWICFYEAVIMLLRYPEFQGLCFVGSLDFDSIIWRDHHNKETEIVFLKFYQIKNLMEFLHSENPCLRGGCQ